MTAGSNSTLTVCVRLWVCVCGHVFNSTTFPLKLPITLKSKAMSCMMWRGLTLNVPGELIHNTLYNDTGLNLWESPDWIWFQFLGSHFKSYPFSSQNNSRFENNCGLNEYKRRNYLKLLAPVYCVSCLWCPQSTDITGY